MSLRIVEQSLENVVDIRDVKRHLRIDELGEDMVIQNEVRAVASWLCGRDGWLGRTLLTTTYELTVEPRYWPGFTGPRWSLDCGRIVLPRPPFQEVLEVAWVDTAGLSYVIAPTVYVVDEGSDGFARLSFIPGVAFPWAGITWERLRITYKAGYGDIPEQIDDGLSQAICMLVARLHENRGEGMIGSARPDTFAEQLLAPYRVWTPPT
jgi:uncharacterized phiE125 gp8 family phage protein